MFREWPGTYTNFLFCKYKISALADAWSFWTLNHYINSKDSLCQRLTTNLLEVLTCFTLGYVYIISIDHKEKIQNPDLLQSMPIADKAKTQSIDE